MLADRGFERKEAAGDVFPAASVYMRFFQPLMPRPAAGDEELLAADEHDQHRYRLETVMANT